MRACFAMAPSVFEQTFDRYGRMYIHTNDDVPIVYNLFSLQYIFDS